MIPTAGNKPREQSLSTGASPVLTTGPPLISKSDKPSKADSSTSSRYASASKRSSFSPGGASRIHRLHYFAWICENRVKWGTKVLHIIITIILL